MEGLGDWAGHQPAPWLRDIVGVLRSASFRMLQDHSDLSNRVVETIRSLLPRVDLSKDLLATLLFLGESVRSFPRAFQQPRVMLRWILLIVEGAVPALCGPPPAAGPSSSARTPWNPGLPACSRKACADFAVALLRERTDLTACWVKESILAVQGAPPSLSFPLSVCPHQGEADARADLATLLKFFACATTSSGAPHCFEVALFKEMTGR